jgi:hypothetical protein
LAINKNFKVHKNIELKNTTVRNELAAEQCGLISETGDHWVCKLRMKAKETTSKSRTAAVGGPLWASLMKPILILVQIKKRQNIYIVHALR